MSTTKLLTSTYEKSRHPPLMIKSYSIEKL